MVECEYIHMSSLMSHDKGRGEAVLMVEGAAANRVAHPGDRGITWGHRREGVKQTCAHRTHICSTVHYAT